MFNHCYRMKPRGEMPIVIYLATVNIFCRYLAWLVTNQNSYIKYLYWNLIIKNMLLITTNVCFFTISFENFIEILMSSWIVYVTETIQIFEYVIKRSQCTVQIYSGCMAAGNCLSTIKCIIKYQNFKFF
jgi:hypothetical protein